MTETTIEYSKILLLHPIASARIKRTAAMLRFEELCAFVQKVCQLFRNFLLKRKEYFANAKSPREANGD